MYILWKYDIDCASGVGGDAEQTHRQTEGVASENKIIDTTLAFDTKCPQSEIPKFLNWFIFFKQKGIYDW